MKSTVSYYQKQIQELSDRIDLVADAVNSHNGILEILIKNLTQNTAKNKMKRQKKK